MIRSITKAILDWQSNESCRAIIIKANNEHTKNKAFCSGGDVVALLDDSLSFEEKAQFFKEEYALNYLIGTCKKPIISILDGITSNDNISSKMYDSGRRSRNFRSWKVCCCY
jgi:3-hydroxyisobutyryl-CoA hydrolase